MKPTLMHRASEIITWNKINQRFLGSLAEYFLRAGATVPYAKMWQL